MRPDNPGYLRSGVLAILAAAVAVALAACGGSSTPRVASLASSAGTTGPTVTVGTTATTVSTSTHGAGSSTTTTAKNNPTALVDEWAACQRSHGDPGQADPVIDAHGVINVTVPSGAPAASDEVHAGVDACNRYMAAAQSALRAADPVQPPPDQTELLQYVNCMRANGVPNYPYPTGDKTDFNGTGVDPTSPFVTKVSEKCGTQLHLPLWWAAGWGPPGDVSVRSATVPGAPRGGVVPAPNGARPSSGSAASGA